MSKMAMMNRMRYAPAAGGLGSLIGGGIKLIGGLFKKKAVQKILTNPLVQGAASGAGMVAVGNLLEGSPKSGGASGGWSGSRRAKGITARELRGFRKVANLLHKEGMVVKRARRGK